MTTVLQTYKKVVTATLGYRLSAIGSCPIAAANARQTCGISSTPQLSLRQFQAESRQLIPRAKIAKNKKAPFLSEWSL